VSDNLNILESIKSEFELSDRAVSEYSPLTLAYIGDSIYALIAKTVIVERAGSHVKDLHNRSIQYVSAVAQAKIVRYLLDNGLLSDEEADILRRGRNAKSPSVAKNASVVDYRLATGLEALIGFLYLQGSNERMIEILKKGFDMIDNSSD